jgi:outer membrane protein assembly factor BamD (BamD/ComL family)
MNSSSSSRARAAAAAAALVVAAGLALGGGALAQESLRPEVGKPLQAAQELIKTGRYKEALGKVHEAEAAGARNANETYLIERMRIAAASGAGDADTAARSFEALNATGRVSGPDKLRMIESIASTFYRSQQYAKSMQWSQRYLREGGNSPAIRTMLIQSQYLSGDFAGATKELMVEIQGAERAGGAPAEDRLKLLLNAASKQGDNNAYVFAMEKLVTYYPRKEYWVDLLSRMQRKAGFSDRLSLDAYRLSLATGSMSAAADYMEMAQLALQADLASEGKQVIDKGMSSGALSTGAQADRAKRLKALVDKKLAEDAASRADDERQAAAAKTGDAMVGLGLNLVYAGQAAQGVQLMQQGIAKGGLKRPEDAKLHLGIGQLAAGDKAKAQATFKTVQGTDGTADLARLWALYARRGAA